MANEEKIEVDAQAGMEAAGGAALARDLLQRHRVAVLATISVRRAGHPFTSLAPYALSADGEPVLLLSALAQHTQNLQADPRASLFVHDPAAAEADPRAAPRLTLLGEVRRAPPEEAPDLRVRYLARHPDARGLLSLDFGVYVLAIAEAQLIGGFAAAGWIPGDQLRTSRSP